MITAVLYNLAISALCFLLPWSQRNRCKSDRWSWMVVVCPRHRDAGGINLVGSDAPGHIPGAYRQDRSLVDDRGPAVRVGIDSNPVLFSTFY